MGKLIKNHWARLIILTAATYQIAAALEGFLWPKIFWDFATKNLDGAVKPLPVLQILNLLLGILALVWEWPLKFVAGTSIHRSIEARLALYPLSSLIAVLMYQSTNPAIYYLVGVGVYFWAYSEGEVREGFLKSPSLSWLLLLPEYMLTKMCLCRVYRQCHGRYRSGGASRPQKRLDMVVCLGFWWLFCFLSAI